MYKLYSVRDKLMTFDGPIAFKEEKIALRWFEADCKRKINQYYTDAKYYDLYEIGTFDPEKGTINGYPESQLKLIKEGEVFDGKNNLQE